MTATTPTNEAQANELGWTIDRHVYPWCAYLGPRFAPEHIVEIDTPAWSQNGRDANSLRSVETPDGNGSYSEGQE